MVFFGLFAKGAQRNLRFKAGVIKTEAECQEWIDNLMRGYPRIREWQENAKKRATDFSARFSASMAPQVISNSSCCKRKP